MSLDRPERMPDAEVPTRLDLVREQVASYRRYVAEVTEVMARTRAELHTGEDDSATVTAQVDGQGLVVGITLSRAAARLDSRDLGAAVLGALRTAEQRRTEAVLALGSRIPPLAAPDPGAVR